MKDEASPIRHYFAEFHASTWEKKSNEAKKQKKILGLMRLIFKCFMLLPLKM